MATLLEPVKIGNLELKNRVVMPPMCMYEVKKQDGIPTAFHCAHYGARAIGQVGLIILEATAVEPQGRLTNYDLGLWNDEQMNVHKELVASLHEFGSTVGVQLGHGGRKSADEPIKYAPSAVAFDDQYGVPQEMTTADINRVKESFASAAARAEKAGFDVVELHGAHGYLLNQFLEPMSNQRTDEYGGSLENRYRLLGEIVQLVKQNFSGSVWVRLSMTAYDDRGTQNTVKDYQQIGQWLERDGADVLDISTGGVIAARPNIHIGPGYQVPFTAAMKEAVTIPVTAVGILEDPQLAEYVLNSGQADLIEIGRGLINDPQWVSHAAAALHDHNFTAFNDSYERGFLR